MKKLITHLFLGCLLITILTLTIYAKPAPKNLLIYVGTPEELSLQEMTPTGKIVATLWQDTEGHWDVPYTYRENYVVILKEDEELSILNLENNTQIALPESLYCYPACFLQNSPIVVYSTFNQILDENKIYLYDYAKEEMVTTLSGYGATVAKLDDTIFFLDAAYDSIAIYSYKLGDPEPVLRHEVLLDDITHDVIAIVPLSHDYYAYLVNDEYEFRYYTPDGPFYDGGMGYANDTPKEQLQLTFSTDGKYAALIENNPGELSYLVVIDLVKQKRITTKYYGFSPYIKDGIVYFTSDPDFVQTKDPAQRPIEKYAIYTYNPAKSSVKLLRKFASEAFIVE